jgi:hypothetical protein
MLRMYFKVVSEEVDKLVIAYNKAYDETIKKVKELQEKIGAKDVYTNSRGHIIGVSFDSSPDTENLYKRVETSLYLPRKNTKLGRKLAKEFDVIKRLPLINDFGILELFDANRSLMEGMTLYSTSIHVIPNTAVYISMPSKDIPLEELERLRSKGQTDTCLNSDIAAAKWVKPDEFTEVKEWEVTKAYEEYNETLD